MKELLLSKPNYILPEIRPAFSSVHEPLGLPESRYYRFWKNQTGSRFHTNKGEVTILHPGEFNPYNGPDFREAVIQWKSGKTVIGDIEFHVEAEDWLHHRHGEDREFEKVILHVALTGKENTPQQLPSHIPLLLLGNVRGNICPHFRCAGLSTHIPQEEFESWMHYFALERWEYLKTFFSKGEKSIQQRILQFIDIKSNRESVHKVTAFYFAAKDSTITLGRERAVLDFARQLTWKMGRKRPASHPLKRLPLLLKIADDYQKLLQELIPVELSSFRQYIAQLPELHPPGKAFLCEIMGNILLPLYAEFTGNDQFEYWYNLPVQPYAITKKLLSDFGMQVRISFGLQQGILGLNKQFCSSQKHEHCPLCQIHLRRNN
ncbi:MAG: DUF2851 family protein [Candidatus Marinimicrobia bacterium]|nr:DUF2851 family protein [Candidatus Neomarinimicrobiota bacterium]